MCGPVFEQYKPDCDVCDIKCSKRGGESVECPNEESDNEE